MKIYNLKGGPIFGGLTTIWLVCRHLKKRNIRLQIENTKLCIFKRLYFLKY